MILAKVRKQAGTPLAHSLHQQVSYQGVGAWEVVAWAGQRGRRVRREGRGRGDSGKCRGGSSSWESARLQQLGRQEQRFEGQAEDRALGAWCLPPKRNSCAWPFGFMQTPRRPSWHVLSMESPPTSLHKCVATAPKAPPIFLGSFSQRASTARQAPCPMAATGEDRGAASRDLRAAEREDSGRSSEMSGEFARQDPKFDSPPGSSTSDSELANLAPPAPLVTMVWRHLTVVCTTGSQTCRPDVAVLCTGFVLTARCLQWGQASLLVIAVLVSTGCPRHLGWQPVGAFVHKYDGRVT